MAVLRLMYYLNVNISMYPVDFWTTRL